MNARKIIGILGGILALLIVSVIAVSLWAIKKLESEKNASRTAKAREARHKPKENVGPEAETTNATELKIVTDYEVPEAENQQSN